MADRLTEKLEEVARTARQQSLCPHPHDHLAFVRTITASGASNIWWRCNDCHANVLGSGYWVPAEYLEETGVDVATLEIVSDKRPTTPPCVVCGKRGTEHHHWAPRHLFGTEADLWPTAWLCRSCHQRWHRVVEHQGKLAVVPLPLEGGGDHPEREPTPRRSA